MKDQDIPALVNRLGQQARQASRVLMIASDQEKAQALRSMANQLESQKEWLPERPRSCPPESVATRPARPPHAVG